MRGSSSEDVSPERLLFGEYDSERSGLPLANRANQRDEASQPHFDHR